MNYGENMESNYVLILLMMPVLWYFTAITYQLIKLFKLWIKFKLENINIKELKIWD